MNDLHVKIQIKKGNLLVNQQELLPVHQHTLGKRETLCNFWVQGISQRLAATIQQLWSEKLNSQKIYRIWIIHIETSTMSVTALNITNV